MSELVVKKVIFGDNSSQQTAASQTLETTVQNIVPMRVALLSVF